MDHLPDVLEDGVQEAEVILLVVDHERSGIGGLRPLEVVQAHELVFVLGARFLDLLGQPGGEVHATFELLPGRGEVRALAEQVPEPDSVVCVDVHSFWCSFWLTAEVVVLGTLIPASLEVLVAGIGIVGIPVGVPAVAAQVGVSPAITPGGVEARSLGVLGVLHGSSSNVTDSGLFSKKLSCPTLLFKVYEFNLCIVTCRT